MVTKVPGPVSQRVPLWTLALVGSGLLIYSMPGWTAHLVYDRTAILSGEVWRLITGNFVHWSTSHLVYDLLALGLAGWMIERSGYPHFGLLCGLSAVWIGVVLLAFQPALQFYGGLSGIATGAVVYCALLGLREPGLWPWICGAALFLTLGKILLETATGQLIVATANGIPFAPMPLGHVVGAMTALVTWCLPGKVGGLHADAVR